MIQGKRGDKIAAKVLGGLNVKAKTAQQLINAMAQTNVPRNWGVWSAYASGEGLKLSISGISYREACAQAKAIREAAGYAKVARVNEGV